MRTRITTAVHRIPFRRAFALSAAALSCVTVAACGGGSGKTTASGPRHLDTHKVALAIAYSILQQRGLHATVTCPPLVLQQKGENFSCTAVTTYKGKPISTIFHVTQRDAKGNVSYYAPRTSGSESTSSSGTSGTSKKK